MPLSLKMRLLVSAVMMPLTLVHGAAHAQTFYSDRAAFDANSMVTSTEDFSGIAPVDGFQAYLPTNTVTLGGFVFTQTANGTANELSVVSNSYYAIHGNGAYNLGHGDFLLAGYGNPAGLTIFLPTGTTAFGLDLGTFAASGSEVTALLSNGSSFVLGNDYPNVSFFGFTSAASITSVTLTDEADGALNNTLSVDTLEAGQAAPVPEASTTVSLGLLLVLGFGGTVIAAKRKKARVVG